LLNSISCRISVEKKTTKITNNNNINDNDDEDGVINYIIQPTSQLLIDEEENYF